MKFLTPAGISSVVPFLLPLILACAWFVGVRRKRVQVPGAKNSPLATATSRLTTRSPLLPILLLFFNADLVQQRLTVNGESTAFVDGFSAWVTGPSTEANREGIQAIINGAMDLGEAERGHVWKREDTNHSFIRQSDRVSTRLFTIKGEVIAPKETAKIVGAIMDSEL